MKQSERADLHRPAVALIGTGCLASAFVPSMLKAGYRFVSVESHSVAGASRFIRKYPGLTNLAGTETASPPPGLILLAVPDQEIRTAASGLVENGPSLKGAVVLHHAGGAGPELLEPAARAGAHCGVLHPLQVLGLHGAEALPGSYARIEGDRPARKAALELAEALNLRPLHFRSRPGAGERAAYHAGAAMAANDMVGLLSFGIDLLVEAGVGRTEATEALSRLASGALRNMEGRGIQGALTGPVIRRDAEGVEKHLQRIGRSSPSAREVHRLLSRRLLELSTPKGKRPDRGICRVLARERKPRK